MLRNKHIFLIVSLISNCITYSFIKQSRTFDQRIHQYSGYGKTHFILDCNKLIAPFIATDIKKAIETEPCLIENGHIKHAFFSSHDNIQKMLLYLIDHEKESIKIAIFSFTDGEIAQALIKAHQRGVKIELITDITCLHMKCNKIKLLRDYAIAILVYNPAKTHSFLNDLMHHKFIIFGKNIHNMPLLWTGSFNFTKAANTNNQENVLLLDDVYLIEKFQNQFKWLQETIARSMATTVTQKQESLNNRKNPKKNIHT